MSKWVCIICSRIQSFSAHMLSRILSGQLFDKLDNMVPVSTMNQCIWDGNCGCNLSAICSFLLSWIFLNTQHIPRYLLFCLCLFLQPCTGNRGVSSSLHQTFLYFLHCCYFFKQRDHFQQSCLIRDLPCMQKWNIRRTIIPKETKITDIIMPIMHQWNFCSSAQNREVFGEMIIHQTTLIVARYYGTCFKFAWLVVFFLYNGSS